MAILFFGCAAGPHDALDGTQVAVRADASAAPQTSYAYVARRQIVAVGLAGAEGLSDDEAHGVIDRIADSAEACFKNAKNLAAGAARITLPIDSGGLAGAPLVKFSPETATPIGMLCLLAPARMSTFGPASLDAGPRSITIESAWGSQ